MSTHPQGQRAETSTDIGQAASEPCEGCGEETAVGSVFFSDRRAVDRSDGRRSYVCTLCDQRLAASRHGNRLSDAELQRLINTAGIAGQVWAGRPAG